MKRLLIAVLAVLMLTACGRDAGERAPLGYSGNAFGNKDPQPQVDIKPILPEEECDFGNFKWGMDMEDVRNVHVSGYSKPTADKLRFERIRIEGFASDAEYVFTDGKLSEATYFIMPDREYEDLMQYLIDYKNLKAIYDERFGAPAEREIEFAHGMKTQDEARQAQLLGIGAILFRTVWRTETTEIRAVMAQKEGICIGVKFTPINNTQTEGTN